MDEHKTNLQKVIALKRKYREKYGLHFNRHDYYHSMIMLLLCFKELHRTGIKITEKWFLT